LTGPTRRSALRRKRERGSYDRETIYAILDEALICHVGFGDGESVFVVPTIHARVGDLLYLHGAAANHMLERLGSGAELCVTVTLVDGLVFARSAFHHSVNYRSVMVFGTASTVVDPEEKRAAVLAIVDHVAKGRTADARPPSEIELRATTVVRVPLGEASAKTRTGPPIEESEDLDLRIWAGEVPLETRAMEPVPAPGLPEEVEVPSYVRWYPQRQVGPPDAGAGSRRHQSRPAPGG